MLNRPTGPFYAKSAASLTFASRSHGDRPCLVQSYEIVDLS
jgi:hypothetical protein